MRRTAVSASTDTRLEPHNELLLGPAPCDRCPIAPRCARERQACDAYALYVYGKSEARWQAAPRAPTRARYEAVFERWRW